MEIAFGVKNEKTSKVSRRFFKKMELDFANTAQQRCGIFRFQKIHFDEVITPPDERRPLPDKRLYEREHSTKQLQKIWWFENFSYL
jgi:hypothetical protein